MKEKKSIKGKQSRLTSISAALINGESIGLLFGCKYQAIINLEALDAQIRFSMIKGFKKGRAG